MTAKLALSGPYFLMTWIFATSSHAFGITRSIEDAKAIITFKLGFEPVWQYPKEGSSIHISAMNIRYGADVLGGVMITPVSLYEVAEVLGKDKDGS